MLNRLFRRRLASEVSPVEPAMKDDERRVINRRIENASDRVRYLEAEAALLRRERRERDSS
jgi:hypothetical protein